MSNWQVLNRVCFTICMICIVVGAALSLTMIWHTFESDVLMKSWSSIGVLFFASAATLVVSRVVGAKGGAPSQS